MDFVGKGCCGTLQCGKVVMVAHARGLGSQAGGSFEGAGLCRVTMTFGGRSAVHTSLTKTHLLPSPSVTFLCPLPVAAVAQPRGSLCEKGGKWIWLRVPPLTAQPGTVSCVIENAEKSSPKLLLVLLICLCFPFSRSQI